MANRGRGGVFSARNVTGTLFFMMCGVVGAIGHAWLENKTDGKPLEVWALHEIAGRNDIEEEYAKEAVAYQKEIESLKNNMQLTRQQQTSRGETERTEKPERLVKEKVIQAIDNNLKGKFKGKAGVIYSAGKGRSVNPMLLAAIIKHETANGSSKVCVKANNPGGINWYKGCGYPKYGWYIKYPTIDDGIYAMANLLRCNYIDKGLKDIDSIGAKYAPVSDSRDGLYGMDNAKWPLLVELHYQKIYKEAT